MSSAFCLCIGIDVVTPSWSPACVPNLKPPSLLLLLLMLATICCSPSSAVANLPTLSTVDLLRRPVSPTPAATTPSSPAIVPTRPNSGSGVLRRGRSLQFPCLTNAPPQFHDAAANGSCDFLVGFLPALSANKGQNKHFVGAFEYALKRINNNLARGGQETSGCRIRYETVDNKADTAESLRGMTQLYMNGAVAFIGPEDTCTTEARLASAWNLPMIAFVSSDAFVI